MNTKLFESYSQYLKEEDSYDIIKSTILSNKDKYGITDIEGDSKKILVKTTNGNYWFVPAGDSIKVSYVKDSPEPIVRTKRGKMSVPKHSWEIKGVFNNPKQATLDALNTLEPLPKDEFVVLLGDEYFGGFDENDQVCTVSSPANAQHFSSPEEAQHIAKQFENSEIEEI